MQKVVLGASIVLVILCIPTLRRAVFSPFVFRVIRSFLLTFFVCALLAATVYAGWYLWRERERQTGTWWNDETIQQDHNPVTPGAGGPGKVIIR